MMKPQSVSHLFHDVSGGLTWLFNFLKAYTLAGANQDALDAYCLGNSWKEALSIAKQLQYSEDAISDLAYSLIGMFLFF